MGLIYHYKGKKNISNILYFLAGSITVFLVVCLVMKINGVFDRFWFMTVEYAFKHSNILPVSAAFGSLMFFLKITSAFFRATLFFLAVYVFLVMLFIRETEKRILYVTLLLFSVAFASSGFYFRNHYFIVLALPAAFIFFERFSYRGKEDEIISPQIKNVFFICFFILLIVTQNNIFFRLSPSQVSRNIFGVNPFPESAEIAKFVADKTNKEDRIAILGSESQIFFYSRRKSATGYTSFIHLMENNVMANKMQIEAIKEIEEANPKYLIYVNIPTSWAMNSKSSMRIFEWFKDKVNKKELELAGLVNIISFDKTEYIWGEEAGKYVLKTPYWVAVFRIVR